MKHLTDNQKEFILTHFFRNDEYAGWKGIAIKLLENGSCIVAGNNCIWDGTLISFFIKTETADGFIDCLTYTFDLHTFLQSEYFKDKSRIFYKELISKRDEEQKKINDLSDKINEIFYIIKY